MPEDDAGSQPSDDADLFRMNRLVFRLVFILVVLSLGCPTLGAQARTNTYPVEVLSVTDGDTFNAEVSVFPYPRLKLETKVRVRGTDTPETGWRAKCPEERELGARAKAAAVSWLAKHSMSLVLSEVGKGKWAGRIVARIKNADGVSLRDHLESQGLARYYSGKGARSSWCQAEPN